MIKILNLFLKHTKIWSLNGYFLLLQFWYLSLKIDILSTNCGVPSAKIGAYCFYEIDPRDQRTPQNL